MKANYDIDIVVLWVDGSDEKWLKEKEKYSKKRDTSHDVVRYRDWEIFHYWFRGIEKFMPWVRKVHLVTWGHLPKWLNVNHPKLHVVRHDEFIPEEFLPTFNSPTIELNIHRISGLSEHFIYFNDDMFVLKSMHPEDFFHQGLPCDSAILNAISCVPGAENESYIQFNNAGIINKYFNKRKVMKEHFGQWFNLKYGSQLIRNVLLKKWPYFTGFYTCHLPTSMRVSTFQEIWEKEGDFLKEMCQNKFRTSNMVNQWLVSEWEMCQGTFFPRRVSVGKAFELTEDLKHNQGIYQVIQTQKYDLVCINDYIFQEKFYEQIKKDLQRSFAVILPEKSGFEL